MMFCFSNFAAAWYVARLTPSATCWRVYPCSNRRRRRGLPEIFSEFLLPLRATVLIFIDYILAPSQKKVKPLA